MIAQYLTARLHAGLGPVLLLSVALLAVACAENPADGVAPARISESTSADESHDGHDHAAHDHGDSVVYLIEPSTSKIGFEGSKVTGSHVGGFNAFDGSITLNGDSPETAELSVTIDTNSIWSDNGQLTGHLKSPDFFDVAQYPEASFVLTDLAATDAGYDLTGDLTLHGVTKRITFPATIEIAEGRVSAKSEFAIDRFDFGIEYKGKADDLIRKEVVIRLEIEAAAAAA